MDQIMVDDLDPRPKREGLRAAADNLLRTAGVEPGSQHTSDGTGISGQQQSKENYAAERTAESRARQGLPRRVQDPAGIARLRVLVNATDAEVEGSSISRTA